MMVFLFPINVFKKAELLPKKTLKDFKMKFSVSSSDRKIKDDKNVYSVEYASGELV